MPNVVGAALEEVGGGDIYVPGDEPGDSCAGPWMRVSYELQTTAGTWHRGNYPWRAVSTGGGMVDIRTPAPEQEPPVVSRPGVSTGVTGITSVTTTANLRGNGSSSSSPLDVSATLAALPDRVTALEARPLATGGGTIPTAGQAVFVDDMTSAALLPAWRAPAGAPLPDYQVGKIYSANGSMKAALLPDAVGNVDVTITTTPGAVILLRTQSLSATRYELLHNRFDSDVNIVELYYNGQRVNSFGYVASTQISFAAQVRDNVLTVFVNGEPVGKPYTLQQSGGATGIAVKDSATISYAQIAYSVFSAPVLVKAASDM